MELVAPPTLTDSARILLAGLRSPMQHETGCVFAMFRACCLLGGAGIKPSSELIRAAMQFLLSCRTPEAHRALVEQLTSCGCEIIDERITPPATLQPLECLDLFLGHLCVIIADELRSLRPAKFRTCKPNRSARRQPWPNCVADIGLQNSSCRHLIDTLLRWTSPAPLGSQIFTLLNALARFWNPIGKEIFVSAHVVQHMRRTLIAAIQSHVIPVPPRSPDFFRRAVAACHKLGTGLLYVDTEFHSNHPYWRNGLCDVAALIVPKLAEHAPHLDEQRKWFSAMLADTGYLVPGTLFTQLEDVKAVGKNDDYFQAYFEMMLSVLRRTCMHIDCPSPPGTPVVTTLCARCGVVNYCSAQCQRAAWNADKCPHKDICTIISRLRERIDLEHPPRSTALQNAAGEEAYKQAARLANEAWRKWLMRTKPQDARALLREKGILPRTCRAIWLYLLRLTYEKGMAKHWRSVWCRRPFVSEFATADIEEFGDPGTEVCAFHALLD
ncbi:hypothetical protein C8R47DRAFT_1152675 [Mycena vitilis]|nr:hypothetical protein C8R47DRAFT_1152675 [Mycena vitilis]